MGEVGRASKRLDPEALSFTVLRGLTMIGGLAALSLVPLRPEHRIHLFPLLSGIILYKLALFALLWRWREQARHVLLGSLGVDLGVVFVLLWFTGGGESHFYLLFYLLVALNAYYFGPAIGTLTAGLSAGLIATANVLGSAPISWTHVAARGVLLGLLGLALGHIAARERAARSRAEQLNRQLEESIARLEQTRAKLLRSEQLATVGRISTKLAHEVNNPIGAISLNVDLLGDIVHDCPGPSMGEATELLRGIRSQVKALAELTREYLTFARLPRARFEEESLNELLEELLSFVRPSADRQGVTLAPELDPLLPLFRFDRGLVRQAVLNLLKNALEVLPRGGRITLTTQLGNGWVEVRVTDTGPGIPEPAASRLFEPFFTTKPHGTGLGLPIARQIVEEHGGTLAWANEPGGGASFAIRLPLKGNRHG